MRETVGVLLYQKKKKKGWKEFVGNMQDFHVRDHILTGCASHCIHSLLFLLPPPRLASGQLCDLILVFFDPMGQALCKRTLNIVEKLNEGHGDKLRFYLSKADEAGAEGDRQVTAGNASLGRGIG